MIKKLVLWGRMLYVLALFSFCQGISIQGIAFQFVPSPLDIWSSKSAFVKKPGQRFPKAAKQHRKRMQPPNDSLENNFSY
jgi:hypothetical protein